MNHHIDVLYCLENFERTPFRWTFGVYTLSENKVQPTALLRLKAISFSTTKSQKIFTGQIFKDHLRLCQAHVQHQQTVGDSQVYFQQYILLWLSRVELRVHRNKHHKNRASRFPII